MSALRPSQSTPQPDLPYELWLSIISNCDYTTRISLSLVSQTFRQRFRPFLFRSITITLQPSADDPTVTSNHILERLKFLQSPPIATAIQSCKLRCHAPLDPSGLPLEIFEPGFAALPSFINMRRLYFDTPTFSTAVIKHLSALHPLKRVTIRLGSVIGTIVPDAYPLIIARHLTLISPWNVAVCELCMTTFDLGELESFLFYAAGRHQTKFLLPTRRLLPKLRFFSININPTPIWSEFCQFLSNCPSLEELRLSVASHHLSERQGLPPVNLPSLRSYSGPAALTNLFMPEHVVAHLRLSLGYDPSTFTSLAGRSPHLLQSVQLVVDIRFLSEALDDISRFPCIRALAFEILAHGYGPGDTHNLLTIGSLLNGRSSSSRPLPKTIEYLSVSFVNDGPTPMLEELLRDATWLQSFPQLRYLSFEADDLRFNHQTQSVPLYEETIGDWVQREMKQYSA